MFIAWILAQNSICAIHTFVKVLGIDYSMTSPAVTLIDGDKATCWFLTSVKRNQLTHTFGFLTCIGDPYPDFLSPEQRYDLISDWAVSKCKIQPDALVIEDYAMGAKGKVFHIGENCGLLKHKLWKEGVKFQTVAPTALKKFASGKGNADKCAMHSAFVQQTGIDLMKGMDKESKDCGSPVSDIVDSYFLARYAIRKQQPN
jgi:hypothetical protein